MSKYSILPTKSRFVLSLIIICLIFGRGELDSHHELRLSICIGTPD